MFYSLTYMYVFSLFSMLMVRKHIFMCLLSLEFIVISLLMMYMYIYMMFYSGMYMSIIMMVFFVCEGVLGLSILVSMIRCYGNDYLSSFNMW